jgi:DNA-binding GntR family transcriptional regulator
MIELQTALAPPRDLSGTTAGRVTEALREEILAGFFAPGMRLKLTDLAARYGVSPLPVREALQRLAAERLIDLAAHRGATVRGLTVKSIRDLYDVREALESLLIERAAERATAGDVAELHRRQRAWQDAATDGDPAPLLATNLHFHAGINAIADNPEAEELVPRGWQQTLALRQRIGFSAARLRAIRDDHEAMIAAIAAHDGEAARRLSRRHVRAAADELIARLAEAGLLPEDPAA